MSKPAIKHVKLFERPDVVLVITRDDYRMIKLALKHYDNSLTTALLRKLKRGEQK